MKISLQKTPALARIRGQTALPGSAKKQPPHGLVHKTSQELQSWFSRVRGGRAQSSRCVSANSLVILCRNARCGSKHSVTSTNLWVCSSNCLSAPRSSTLHCPAAGEPALPSQQPQAFCMDQCYTKTSPGIMPCQA